MATFSLLIGNGLLSLTRVPNLELLSIITNLLFSYLIIACNLDTEISVIRIWH